MASRIAHFHNSAGHERVEIGVREFMCVGANPPFDHPHVFLDMGRDVDKVCPYCSTLFVFNGDLSAAETKPEGCEYRVAAA